MMLLLATLAHAGCVVLDDVQASLPTGPVEGQTVVLVGSRIAAVGATDAVSGLTRSGDGARYDGQDCTLVEGKGRPLTPGLVMVDNQLGLVEIRAEDGSRNDDPHTRDAVRAALDVGDAYDPHSSVIGVQRMEGVTHSVITPVGGGFVRGQAAAVRLLGHTQEETVLERGVAMVVDLPSGSRAESLRQLRELVADVRSYARDKGAFDANRRRDLFPDLSALDLEALIPAVRGEQPILVGANRASDLEALVRLQEDLGIRLVIRGAAEGWRVAERLAQAEIPVMVDPMMDGVEGFDALGARADNAKLLAEAGVKVMFHGAGTHNLRLQRHKAGNAVRAGMDHELAVKGLTEVPAEVFGLEGIGTIEVGGSADVVLWSGDPLEVSTLADGVWIGGEAVPLVSRQTVLRDRYRDVGKR